MNKPNLFNPIHFLALGLGSGLIKPAPGTWGSLVGIIFATLLWQIIPSSLFFIFLSILGFIFGCYLCQKTSEDLGVHDDGRIVWDEIIAIFFMFAFLPEYSLFYYGLTFITFRLFDITKPPPIKFFDTKITNGLGIMIDDILAAIYALALLHLISGILKCI